MCTHGMCMLMWVPKKARGLRTPEVTDTCELSDDVDAKNCAGVLCKSSLCSRPLSHLSCPSGVILKENCSGDLKRKFGPGQFSVSCFDNTNTNKVMLF